MATPASKIVYICFKDVERRWGKNSVDRLGETLYWALVGEQLLVFAAGQDDSIDREVVAGIVCDGYGEILNRRYPDG